MEPFEGSFGGSLWSAVVLEAAAFALLAAAAISLALARWDRRWSDDARDGPEHGREHGRELEGFGAGLGLDRSGAEGGPEGSGADPPSSPSPRGALGFLLGGVLGLAVGLRARGGGQGGSQGGARRRAWSRAWSRARDQTRVGGWAARPGGRLPAAPAAFLFEDGRLVDASPGARRLLRGVDRRGGDLKAVQALLARRFGADLPERLLALGEGERLTLTAEDGEGLLEAEREEGSLRLLLGLGDPEADMGRLALEAALAELGHLRALAEDAPGPIWALDGAGAPVWANRAYLQLADLAQGGAQGGPRPAPTGDAPPDHRPPERARAAWPARPLFEPPAGLAEGQSETRRQSLQLPGKPDPEWFDVTSVRRGSGSIHFGTDVGRLVGAETSRSTFVQTLSKAFAHLSVGLAVFDKQRRLVLFNPAFADLTGLSFSFLSGRPLVHSVLDRLRESQVLPEPRNYASWRDGVAALEAKASAGHYCETWTLPDGRTYRVTGKPHPDGALAFLVEDITDEIALARRVHAELDTARAVLDSLEEGVAVFTAAGTLSLSNRAYDALGGALPEACSEAPPSASPDAAPDVSLVRLTDAGLWDELGRWERLFGPSPLWGEIRAGRAQRGGGAAELLAPGGRAMLARATPLPGGGLAVGFSLKGATGNAAPPPSPPGEGPAPAQATPEGGARDAPALPSRAAR